MRCKILKPIVLDRKYIPGDVVEMSSDQYRGINRVQARTLQPLEVTPDTADASAKNGPRITTLPELAMHPHPALDIDMPKDDCWLPPRRGDANCNDITPLGWIADTLAPAHILELGTAHGWTTLLLAKLTGADIVTVNALPDQVRGRLITQKFTAEEIGRLFRGTEYEDRIQQVYANTLQFDAEQYATHFEDTYNGFDLAIVDACHDEDFVLSDFHTCRKALAPGGVIMLHDVYDGSEPYEACVQLRNERYNIAQIAGTTWGIFVDGGLAASAIDHLFAGEHYEN